MIAEDILVELVKHCSIVCQVLRTVRNLGCFSDQIEDLGRWVSPGCPILLILTNLPRIVRDVESMVRERANCPRDLRGDLPTPAEERINVWLEDLREILRILVVGRSQLTVATPQLPSEGPLGEPERALVPGHSVVLESMRDLIDSGPGPASVMASCRFVVSAPDPSLTVGCRPRRHPLWGSIWCHRAEVTVSSDPTNLLRPLPLHWRQANQGVPIAIPRHPIFPTPIGRRYDTWSARMYPRTNFPFSSRLLPQMWAGRISPSVSRETPFRHSLT